jgi:hypothetical protein
LTGLQSILSNQSIALKAYIILKLGGCYEMHLLKPRHPPTTTRVIPKLKKQWKHEKSIPYSAAITTLKKYVNRPAHHLPTLSV